MTAAKNKSYRHHVAVIAAIVVIITSGYAVSSDVNVVDVIADVMFTTMLDVAYAVHGTLTLTPTDNIDDDDGTLELEGADGITTFTLSDGNTYAAVASQVDDGVQILNVTDPTAITATHQIDDTTTLELEGADGITTFTLSDGNTYAAVASLDDNGVQILNVTDPTAITATHQIDDTTTLELAGASGITTFTLSDGNTYAAVASEVDNGVQILNVTDPTAITATDRITGSSLELEGATAITTFTLSDGNTYAAVASRIDNGVQILNVTDPTAITATAQITDNGSLELEGAHDVTTFTSDGNTYAAVASWDDNGVQILNVTDPTAITATAQITDDGTVVLGTANEITIFTSGDHTYAAVASQHDGSGASNTGGVQILDVTDPTAITATAQITDSGDLELDVAAGIATFTLSDNKTYIAVTAYDDDGVQIMRVDFSIHGNTPTGAFVTTWDATTSPRTVSIPVEVHTGETLSVSWGDGESSTHTTNGTISHTYDTAGEYQVAMTGGLSRINLGASDSTASLLESIDQWGDIEWATMNSAFGGAYSMVYNAVDAPDLSGVTDMSLMFATATSFNGDISTWNVSSVTDMSRMFRSATSFDQPLNDWNVSSVIDMRNMFARASSFNGTISDWNVSSVTGMNNMFNRATSFNQTLNDWDVSSVTDMSYMFDGATSFDQPLNDWNVSSVTDMSYMFVLADSFNGNISDWDVSSVTDMSSMFAFAHATSFDQPLNDWNVSSVTDMSSMFANAFLFNQTLNDWNVSSVTDMSRMFYNTRSFDQPLNTWNVSSVTDMSDMFAGPHFFSASFDQPLNDWDVSSVTDMSRMFNGANSFNQPLNTWNVSSVTGMVAMFGGATAFDQPLNDWNVSSVSNMNSMFSGATAFDQNLGKWYVVPVVMDIAQTDVPGVVGSISTQNSWLVDNHAPMYGIGTGGDSNRFEIVNGNQINMTSVEAKSAYKVNVTASGPSVFENGNNWRVLDVTVTGTSSLPAGTFVTTWDATTSPRTVSIPVEVHTGETLSVSWGDGESSTHTTNGTISHTYDTAGEYQVAMTGGLSRINLGASDSTASLLESIDQWGDIEWATMNSAFRGANSMVYNAVDAPDLSGVTDMFGMFNGANSFNQPLNTWNVSSVTGMVAMFGGARAFNQPLNDWDVSSVTDMSRMFNGANSFDQPLNDWDVSSVTSMSSMFASSSFNQTLNDWDVSSVTDMSFMFLSATSFDQPLNDWDVSSVTDMRGMFQGATAFNRPLNTWNVSSVTGMVAMFGGARAFNQPLNDWDVSSVTDMSRMFNGATSFDGNISGWNVSSVTDMSFMFLSATSFDQPLNDWDVSSVTDMSFMFLGATSFDQPLNDWDVSSVTDMRGMFQGATAFNRPLNDWDVSSVTNMNSMFIGSPFSSASFDQPLNDWDVSSVTDMSDMFSGATSFDGNISGWNVSSVTDMAGMFRSATSFDQPLNDWDVSSVTDMSSMFGGATAFNQNLGNWYVVSNSTSIASSDVPGIVGSISAQNLRLNEHDPTYSIVTGSDSTRFEIVPDNQLNMTSVGTKSDYTVNVTASGGSVFEDGNNWRLLEIEVTDQTTDITPPAISGAVAASLNSVTVRFSENVNADATDGSHWSLDGTDAGSLTVSANTDPAGSSNSMTLTLSGDLPDTGPDDLELIYAKPTTGGITDGTNQLEDATVIVVDGIAPTVTSARAASGTVIALTISEDVSDNSATPGDFSLSGVASSPTVSSISVSGITVTLTLSSTIVTSDSPLLSYSRTSGFVQDVSTNPLADFSSVAVDTSADITPPSMSGAVAASLNSVTVRFSENVNADATDGSHWSLDGTDAGSLTVSANTDPAGSSNSMTLTLSGDLPDTGPDDLELIYAKPTTGGITDGTNQLEDATVIVVDGIAPTVTSARAASGTVIALTISEDVSDNSATPGDFSLSGVASSPTVSSISVSGITVTLTLSSTIVTSDSPLLSYSRTSGFVQDVSTNPLADFSSVAVDTSADITPPSMSGAVAASLNSVTVRFSENVNADATDGSHWSLDGTDAGSLTVSANTDPAGSSNSMTLTLSGDLPDTGPDDLELIYAKPTTGGITDGTNQLEDATVTVADGIAPTVTSARAASGTVIALTISEDVSDNSATPGDFSLSGVASSPTVSSISVSGITVTLTLSSTIVTSDSPLLSYSRTSGFVQDVSTNPLADFSSVAVDTSADITPPSMSGAVAASLNSVTVRFSENVNADATDGSHWSLDGTDAGSLTVSANTDPAGSSNSMTLTLSGDLPDTGPDDLELIYAKPTTGGITDGTNQLEDATVIVVDGIAPTVTSARAASGTVIALTISEDVSDNSATPGDFSLSGVASSPTVSSISVSGITVTLTLSSTIVTSDSPLLSYSRTSGFVQDVSTNPLADFSSVAVDTSADITPPSMSGAVAASLNSVTVRFSENVNADATDGSHWSLDGTDAGSLTVSANTDPAGSSNSMTLTLSGDLPDTGPDDLELIYAKPTTGGITDGTNQLEDATVTVADGIAPTVTSARAASGTVIALTISEDVSDNSATPGDFSLSGVASSPTVSSISVSGITVTLTLSSTIVTSDSPLLSYSRTSGFVQDVSTNPLADFSSVAVDTSADITPPSMSGAVAASLNSVTVRFSENVNADATDGSHWSLDGTDAGSLTVSANTDPAGSSNSMTLTLSGDLPDTGPDDLELIYAKPTTGGITDGTNQLEDATVIVADGIAPTVTSARAASGTVIALTISEDVSDNSATPGDFSLSGVASSPTVSSISVSGITVTLTLSSTIVTSDSPLLSYSRTSGFVQDVSTNPLADFSSVAVDTSADITPPTVTSLTTSEQSPTNSTNAVFTVTFSEDVTFDRDILVTGGTASPAHPTGTASSFTFTVTPDGDGEVMVQTPASSANDNAGNGNLASDIVSLTFDRTKPVITPPGNIRLELGGQYVQPAATCSDAIDRNPAVTVTVDDVDVNQVGVYTLTHACTDDAGNSVTATSTVIVFDPSGFATTITTDSGSLTNSASVDFTVAFEEELGTDTLVASEIEVSPPVTVSNLARGSDDTYTFTLAGLTDNTYTVTVPQGVVNSTLGNPNSIASIRVTVDRTAPTVTSLTASEQSPTNVQGATFTVTFSEPVAFDSGISDISVTGGAASNLSPSGTASSFTFTVTPAGDGEVTVQVLSGTTRDRAGNYNTASGIAFLTFDRTAPTVTSLTASEQSPTNSADAVFTVTFSEDVTFAGDILVTGGTASPARPTGTASSFTFTVTPDGDGEVTVRIPPGTIRDGAGNGNPSMAETTLEFDRTAPTVTSLTASEQSPTNSTNAVFTVTFSEDVTFAGDILVTGGTASPARPTGTASSFTFTVTPAGDGEVTVQTPASSANDNVGNGNLASDIASLTFDRTDPVITPPSSIRLELGDRYMQPAATCSDAIDHNPAVTVTVDDVDVNQVGVYTLTHACTDDAGNSVTATSTVTVFDPSGFATTITTDSGSLTNSASVDFTVAFEEELGTDTLVASEIEVSPPVTVSNLARGSDDTYTFTLAGLTDNTYTVTVPQGVVNSTLGNPNSIASIRVTVDRTAPTVTSLTASEHSPTNVQGATFTATFSEPVAFDSGISDISVTGGAASNLSPSGTASSFTFTVTPAGDGEVTVQVLSGTTRDGAGNYNTASGIAFLTFDRTAPTVTSLTASEQSPTNSADAVFTVTFSEDVTFAGDILVTGGTASPARPTGTASSFTFTVTPDGDGEVTVRIPPGTIRDGAGNGNPSMAETTLEFDRTAPTVTSLTASEQSPTNSADAVFTVTFSEDVTFAGDILVTGGTASPARPTGTASSFTFTVTPAGDGEVTVQTPASSANDNVGNGNLASDIASLTFDRTDPVITPPSSIRLELGDRYMQPAATCSDAIDHNPAVTVTVDDVDVNQVGVYTLTHACTDDAGNSVTATSTVTVFDPSGFATSITSDPASPTSSPSVEFTVTFEEALGANEVLTEDEIHVSPESPILNLAVSGIDSNVYTFRLGNLNGTYQVSVQNGAVNNALGTPNALAGIRVVVDRTDPAIVPPIGTVIQIGHPYHDATCTDNLDGNPVLTAIGAVDTGLEGTYPVTYRCTDALGNSSILDVVFTVINDPPEFRSASLGKVSKEMVLRFSEPVLPASPLSGIYAHDTGNSTRVDIQGTTSPDTHSSTVTITLGDEVFEQIVKMDAPQIDIDAMAFSDEYGKVMAEPVSNLALRLTSPSRGGGEHPPIIDLGTLAYQRLADIPPHIAEQAASHDASEPLEPITPDDTFDLPLVIDGYGYLLDDTTNTLVPQTVRAGDNSTTHITFTVYTQKDLAHFILYLNLQGENTDYADSDTYITYEGDGTTVVTDPHGYITGATITVTHEDDQVPEKKTVRIIVEFAEPMGPTNMVAYLWNTDRKAVFIRVIDALDVVAAPPQEPEMQAADPEPVPLDGQMPADPEPVPLDGQMPADPEPVPLDGQMPADPEPISSDILWFDDYDEAQVLHIIRMWSGFESEFITDTQLLELLGLEDYQDVDLPDWMMTQLGVLVAKGDVTVGEFVLALQYVLTHA